MSGFPRISIKMLYAMNSHQKILEDQVLNQLEKFGYGSSLETGLARLEVGTIGSDI